MPGEVETPAPATFLDLLGMRRMSRRDGRARFDVDVRDEHMNGVGVVHGGIVFSIVDTAMGGAVVSVLERGQSCTTIEIKINYLAPVTGGALRAEARVVQRGDRVAVLDAKVHDERDRLVAAASGTFFILSRD